MILNIKMVTRGGLSVCFWNENVLRCLPIHENWTPPSACYYRTESSCLCCSCLVTCRATPKVLLRDVACSQICRHALGFLTQSRSFQLHKSTESYRGPGFYTWPLSFPRRWEVERLRLRVHRAGFDWLIGRHLERVHFWFGWRTSEFQV